MERLTRKFDSNFRSLDETNRGWRFHRKNLVCIFIVYYELYKFHSILYPCTLHKPAAGFFRINKQTFMKLINTLDVWCYPRDFINDLSLRFFMVLDISIYTLAFMYPQKNAKYCSRYKDSSLMKSTVLHQRYWVELWTALSKGYVSVWAIMEVIRSILCFTFEFLSKFKSPL